MGSDSPLLVCILSPYNPLTVLLILHKGPFPKKNGRKTGKINTFWEKNGHLYFLSFASSLASFYRSFYHLIWAWRTPFEMTKITKKTGRITKKRAIFPKRPFKRACPFKNGRHSNTGMIHTPAAAAPTSLSIPATPTAPAPSLLILTSHS